MEDSVRVEEEENGVRLVHVRGVCPRCQRRTKRYPVEESLRHRKLRVFCGDCVRVVETLNGDPVYDAC